MLARSCFGPIRELSWGSIHIEFRRFALVPSPVDRYMTAEFVKKF